MRTALLTAVLVSLGAVFGQVEDAQAFGHKVRTTCIAYYPGLYSFPVCGCGYPPYVYSCAYRYPKFCGRRKACWRGYLSCASCAPRYAACGYGACGYGAGCGCGSCAGGSCGYGCGGCEVGSCGGGCGSCGGCGTGSCSGGSCGMGSCDGCGGQYSYSPSVSAPSSFETDEKVLYDGPAPAPESVSPEAGADPSASNNHKTAFRLAARTRRSGTSAYTQGLRAYWDGNMNAALRSFDAAAAAEPENALYHYYRALAFYNLQGPDAAGEWLQRAVELETQTPVKNFGRSMERVQGPARLWVEAARRDAGVGR